MEDRNRNQENKSATVLLVEDNKPMLEFFYTVLRREGYNVLFAENGIEALQIAETRPNDPIDILLSDVSMPYMGGIQLAERLRKTRPNIQVLLTSGMPHQEISARCGSGLRAEFLPKPFTVSALADKVRTLAAAV